MCSRPGDHGNFPQNMKRFALALLLCASAMAQDLSMFSAWRWRNIGPLRGGRSVAVAGSALRPLEYYFGATGGGLWKTIDGGTSWNPVSDSFFETSSVGAVAVAPSNPDVVYAGMGETELRGNIIQGDGVYKSVDGGKTWMHAGLEKTMAIARLRVDPSNPDLVYAAAFGDPYGKNPERGVFRSRDGGRSWQKILYRDEKTGAIDLALDPHDRNIVYASLWEAFRTPYSLSSGGPGSGLFKSTDGGDHWTELTHNSGVPGGVLGKITIAVSADPKRLYALFEAQEGGLFRSDDAGTTWTLINNNRSLWQRAFYFHRVYADPVSPDTVYVSNYELNRSTDGGRTFKIIPSPHSDHHDFWIASNDPNRMIDSNDGGANVSVTAGHTWTAQTFSTAQMYHVVTTRHTPYEVCGAQQDNTTLCVPSNGRGESFYPVGGGESGYVAADPLNTNIFYAGSYGGYITRLDHSTHQQRDINVWPEYPVGQSAEDLKERFQWTTPIVFSPVDPKTLYTSSQHLFKTTNEGQTWTPISPDLTRHDPATLGPSGGPITHDQTGVETYATIFTVAPSRLDGNLIWTGSDDGFVYVTRDGGKNWANVTPPDLPPLTRISLIEASPHDRAIAYVAANRYQAADRRAYVYKTSDFGKTWTKIVDGIAPGDFARAIREDTVRRNLLYLGTERGFYISFDGGARWQAFRLNLPVTPVHDIAVEKNDLILATHGRGFYALDNIGPLRQLGPGVTQSPIHIFKPADATRGVTRVSIDYYLAGPFPDLKLEIVDASGNVVRAFTAGAAGPEPASDDDDSPPPPRAIPARKGLNRFQWDLRAAPSHAFPGLIMYQANVAGPFVPPGRYTARLTAAGSSPTQDFVVLRDPRSTTVTDADLHEQFRFAREIQDKFSQTNDTVVRIRRIKSEIADRISRGASDSIASAGQKLTAELTAVEGLLYQYRNRATKDPLNFPPQLNNKLGSLLAIVESADARPTDSSYVVYKQLADSVDRQVANLADLLGRDLTAFNKILATAQLPPVSER
jgi:photosystem II stability/assembly factor-like uncharacterized protein